MNATKSLPVAKVIRTTSQAKNPPQTAIIFDYPHLTIVKGMKRTDYTVQEFSTPWDGRAVQVTKRGGGGEVVDVYNVFICRRSQNNLCECRGFESTGHCCHMDAVRTLVHDGMLDEAVSQRDRVEDQWPSPEQMMEEAGIDNPFKGF